MNMKCPKCGYEWEPKIPNPKECPRCKGRLDYTPGPVGAPKVWKKKEVGKEMTSRKLPLAAAAIIIVAAVGAWAILSTSTTPTGPSWGYVLGENASYGNSGIVAMYLAKEGTNFDSDPSEWTIDNYYDKITAQGNMTIPYEENFYIVVEAKGVKPYIAYLVRENIKVELGLTGDLSLPAENKTGTQFSWYTVEGDNIRVSAVWGPYKLAADQSFNYTAKVWLWY
jgi:hypothetical protein